MSVRTLPHSRSYRILTSTSLDNRWDWCREQFFNEFDLRDHVMQAHVETSEAVPKESLHVWQSSNGAWKGRQKDYREYQYLSW
jgi:hypothetical protein